MDDYDSTSNVDEKNSVENSKNAAIRDTLTEVIQQVENMTCVKSVDCNDDSRDPCCKSDHANISKSSNDSVTEKSKHRSGNRRNHVRHRKHKWKPYHKLTGDERRRLEERISRRAYRNRERMSASGLTLAPYNTTQFLMEDHNVGEPDYDSIHHESKNREDYNSSDDYYSSPDDEEEFIQQQFSETYDSFHDDYINDMSKSDLVRELIRLEDEIDSIEHSLKNTCREKKSELDVEAEMEKIQVFQVEIEKLTHENHILEKANEIIRNQLSRFKEKSLS